MPSKNSSVANSRPAGSWHRPRRDPQWNNRGIDALLRSANGHQIQDLGSQLRPRPILRILPPQFFVPFPKQLVGVLRYVSHVGTSWTLTFNSPIIRLVVDFCPSPQFSPFASREVECVALQRPISSWTWCPSTRFRFRRRSSSRSVSRQLQF